MKLFCLFIFCLNFVMQVGSFYRHWWGQRNLQGHVWRASHLGSTYIFCNLKYFSNNITKFVLKLRQRISSRYIILLKFFFYFLNDLFRRGVIARTHRVCRMLRWSWHRSLPATPSLWTPLHVLCTIHFFKRIIMINFVFWSLKQN